jgi:hypothetical protein
MPPQKKPPQETDESASIADFWAEVRGPGKPRKPKSGEHVLAPPLERLVEWTTTFEDGERRQTTYVLPCSEQNARDGLIRAFTRGDWRRFSPGIVVDTDDPSAWLKTGLLDDFTKRVARLTAPCRDLTARWFPPFPGQWEILWGLVATEPFVIEEPLRAMVDQSFYLVHDVYRALWEARFLVSEETPTRVTEFIGTLTRWLSGSALSDKDQTALGSMGIKRLVRSEDERYDVLLFLVTLAAQNLLLTGAVFYFDGLECTLKPEARTTLRQLHTYVNALERWTRIGACPVSVIIGFSGTARDRSQLKKLNPKLAASVGQALIWTKQSRNALR